jgi:very-short-patch-repair endonuclease
LVFNTQSTYKYEWGTKNGWVDVVSVNRRLIIDLDGNHHHTRHMQYHTRDAPLPTRGYEVIRITHAEYRKKIKLDLIREKLGMITSPA